MRTLAVLRPLVVAILLSAPLAQAALAGQQVQQALSSQSAASAPISITGPYDHLNSTAGN